MFYDGIKFLIMDVDGTLTDGSINIGSSGELYKKFNVKDGCGIKEILPKYGIIPVIITARNNKILEKRCEELDIQYLFQGIRNKVEKIKEILNQKSKEDSIEYTFKNIAYMGDDILDLPCIEMTNSYSGISGCPKDAIDEIKNISAFVSEKNGGDGAVRQFINYITNRYSKYKDIKRISIEAYNFIIEYLNGKHTDNGKYDLGNGVSAVIKNYETDFRNNCKYESHKKFIDIQMVLEGEEIISVTDVNKLIINSEYDPMNDVTLYEISDSGIDYALREKDYVILDVNDAHMPCVICNQKQVIKKLVIKVPVN